MNSIQHVEPADVGEDAFYEPVRPPPLSRADRAGLARLRVIMRQVRLPVHGGDLAGGRILWWPATQSGRVSIYGNVREGTCLLIDRSTGYWLLTRETWQGWSREILQASGGTLTSLVARRMDCDPDDAADRIIRWCVRSMAHG